MFMSICRIWGYFCKHHPPHSLARPFFEAPGSPKTTSNCLCQQSIVSIERENRGWNPIFLGGTHCMNPLVAKSDLLIFHEPKNQHLQAPPPWRTNNIRQQLSQLDIGRPWFWDVSWGISNPQGPSLDYSRIFLPPGRPLSEGLVMASIFQQGPGGPLGEWNPWPVGFHHGTFFDSSIHRISAFSTTEDILLQWPAF